MDVDWIYSIMADIALGLDIIAVLIISIGLLRGLFGFLYKYFRKIPNNVNYKIQSMKSLQIGLDYIVAADIINSLAIKSTINDVFVLSLLIIIRTFLSWTITVEEKGRWPWQAPRENIESKINI